MCGSKSTSIQSCDKRPEEMSGLDKLRNGSHENEVCRLSHAASALGSTFLPITMELRLDTISDLLAVAEERSGGRFAPSKPFCLVGLHTCGDLGSTALRLFTQVPTAKALCIVGCCYHHITETVGEQSEFIWWMRPWRQHGTLTQKSPNINFTALGFVYRTISQSRGSRGC